MIVSHNLDIRLGIDFSPLLNSNNLNGAAVALGAKNDEDIIRQFTNNIVKDIERLLDGFVNVEILSATVNLTDGADDAVENGLVNQVQEHLANIEDGMGKLESIIVNSESLNKIISKQFNIPYDMVIFRPGLESNYVIRFVDCQGHIKEIGG